jgi:hypothetical protein
MQIIMGGRASPGKQAVLDRAMLLPMTDSGLLTLLQERQGGYVGEGINHEGEPFRGRLRLSSASEGAGILLAFDARSLDEQICFHAEHSLIARDASGELVLWHLGSNLGFLTPHNLSAVEPERRYAFLYGDPAGDGFAEEITLTLDGDRIGYAFAWGRPGAPFGPRSSVVMAPMGGNVNEVPDGRRRPRSMPVFS